MKKRENSRAEKIEIEPKGRLIEGDRFRKPEDWGSSAEIIFGLGKEILGFLSQNPLLEAGERERFVEKESVGWRLCPRNAIWTDSQAEWEPELHYNNIFTLRWHLLNHLNCFFDKLAHQFKENFRKNTQYIRTFLWLSGKWVF